MKAKQTFGIVGMFLLAWQIKLRYEIPERFSTLHFHLMLDAIGRNEFFPSPTLSISLFPVLDSNGGKKLVPMKPFVGAHHCGTGDEDQFYLRLMRHTVIHRGHVNE